MHQKAKYVPCTAGPALTKGEEEASYIDAARITENLALRVIIAVCHSHITDGSRVGDAKLRQHCVDAVLDQIHQADKRVQDVVSALHQALKVVQASRYLQKSLVLNSSDQVQASFRQLGDSCNQIGPLLRLLHRNMGTSSSTSTAQPATTTTSAVLIPAALEALSQLAHTGGVPQSKPAADTSSTTASEYDPSDKDDEPEVVEVEPPKRNKKRKAETVDLSEETPAVRRKMLQDTKIIRDQLAKELQVIQTIPMAGYTVAIHKELSSFLKKVFAANEFHSWQPRDDPVVARLMAEMKKRMNVFKESMTQSLRLETIETWQNEMSALAFSPSLDLTSIPPLKDPRAANVERCHESQDPQVFAICANRICSKLQADTSSPAEVKQKYFQPLLDATTKYFAAVAAGKSPKNGVCHLYLRVFSRFAGGGITCKECAHLEELLYLVRLVMSKGQAFRKKAVTRVPSLLALFPPSTRPVFYYPASEPVPQQKKKKCKKKKKASS